jgi:hypothetical protein
MMENLDALNLKKHLRWLKMHIKFSKF